MKTKCAFLTLAAALALVGCGDSTTTTIGGENTKPGVYKGAINNAKDVAGGASAQTQQNEADFGGK
jgi:hypothetical protein